jgi:hypothetical protein
MKAWTIMHCCCSVVDTCNSTDQSPSWGVERSLYSIYSLSRNQKSHFSVHSSPLLDPNLSHTNQVHTSTFYFFKFQWYFRLRLGLPMCLFSSGHPTKISFAFISPLRATYLNQLAS